LGAGRAGGDGARGGRARRPPRRVGGAPPARPRVAGAGQGFGVPRGLWNLELGLALISCNLDGLPLKTTRSSTARVGGYWGFAGRRGRGAAGRAVAPSRLRLRPTLDITRLRILSAWRRGQRTTPTSAAPMPACCGRRSPRPSELPRTRISYVLAAQRGGGPGGVGPRGPTGAGRPLARVTWPDSHRGPGGLARPAHHSLSLTHPLTAHHQSHSPH